MSEWHPSVLPILLFISTAFSMCALILRMGVASKRASAIAAVLAIVLPILMGRLLGLPEGIATLAGLVFGYVVMSFGIAFFRHAPASDELYYGSPAAEIEWRKAGIITDPKEIILPPRQPGETRPGKHLDILA